MRRSSVLWALVILGCLVGDAFGRSSIRTLVIVDSMRVKESHSRLFKELEKPHELEFVLSSSSVPALVEFGVWKYEALVIMSSESSFGFVNGRDDVVLLREFVDAGNNVMIVTEDAGGDVSDVVRDFAVSCGVEFDSDKSGVIDHFAHTSESHGHVIAKNVIKGSAVTKFKDLPPVLFNGIAHTRASWFNPLILPIIRGSETSISVSDYEDLDLLTETVEVPPFAVGRELFMVSALQAHNNARVTFVGSLSMFSDSTLRENVEFDGKTVRCGNEELLVHLVRWAFKRSGVLRVTDVSHSLHDGNTPEMYTVRDEMDVAVGIEEWDDVKGDWVPHKSNDVMFMFKRIDPFVQHVLTPSSDKKSSLFTTTFTVPDVIGVYTLAIDYHAPGYTHERHGVQVVVRPFRHDEYERFIPAAFPYYASVFSVMAGAFVFAFVFLYTREPQVINQK